jgi:PAS domain S-box-containing protein
VEADDSAGLAALFASTAAEAFFLTDAAGHVRFMNPAARRLLGWSFQELRGRTLHEALHAQLPDGTPCPRATCPLEGVLASGQALPHHEDWLLHQEGHFVPVLCSSTPLLRNGRVAGAALVVHDLTARKQAETEEKKRSAFEQQLIGIVSHDLRNPLQAIRLSAALGLRSPELEPRHRRLFERIVASGDRALRMIEDLLDFTRVRLGGGIELAREPVDLHTLTAQVVDEVLVTRPERQVTVEAVGDGRGYWDAGRLSQVVQNLVGNALQHTTEDTLVRVRTQGEGPDVVLEVHNGGPPIPPEDLPRLFEPFQRGQNKRPDGGRSMGLGLHITHHLVQAHGGRVQVTSTAAEGTTFTVRLSREEPGNPQERVEP